MGWIESTNLKSHRIHRSRHVVRGNETTGQRKGSLFERGTLLVEFEYLNSVPGGVSLLQSEVKGRWPRYLALHLTQDNRVLLSQERGHDGPAIRLQLGLPDTLAPGRLRIYYSWDVELNMVRMFVEGDSLDAPQVIVGYPAFPISRSDLQNIVRNPFDCSDDSVKLLAFSGEIETVPLGLGVDGDTLIETPVGEVQLAKLRVGDLVITNQGEQKRVRHVCKTTLPQIGLSRAIHLRAPYFGLTRDLICSPQYRVQLSGGDFDYYSDDDGALLEARFLSGHPGVSEFEALKSREWYFLLLDDYCLLRLSGISGETMHLNRELLSDDVIVSSELGPALETQLPTHATTQLQALGGSEAKLMVASRLK